VNPVRSQNKKGAITLSLRTRPSIEPVKTKSAKVESASVRMMLEDLAAHTTIN
jgi:hypothetical protein